MARNASVQPAEGSCGLKPAPKGSAGWLLSLPRRPGALLTALLIAALLLASLSSGSLWIDEGDTACYAIQPSLSAWVSHLSEDRAADCQFPLYMFLVWAWAKVAGGSEYALRSLNVCFAMGALAAFAALGRVLRAPRLWLALLIQPFFWYYLNEARPYMLQLAAGSLLLTAFLMLLEHPQQRGAWVGFLGGVLLLHYSTMLAPVTVGAFVLGLLLLIRRKELSLPPGWLRWVAGLAVALTPGVIHYINTVLRGSGGSRIWSVGAANFAWVYYELVGAIGLGPPVWRMRDFAREALAGGISPHALKPLLLAAVLCGVLAGVFVLGFRCSPSKPGPRRVSFYLAILFLFVFVSFAALALVLQKPVWARHLAPVFPVYALACYYAIGALWSAGQGSAIWRRFLAGSCALLLAISSTLLVVSPVHAKDDYRLAARLAQKALKRNQVVWWAASWHTGAYYGLPIVEGKSTSSQLRVLMGPVAADLKTLEKPDLVLVSRKDVFDSSGSIRDYCNSRSYQAVDPQPHVFTAWQSASTFP